MGANKLSKNCVWQDAAAFALMLATTACVMIAAMPHAYAAGDVVAGERVFKICAECHQVGPSARAGFGPQLNGIIGRAAASTKDYPYSAAMRNSHIVWSEDKLRRFLKGPSDLVPGTKMRLWGLNDEQDVNNLLAYLRGFNAAGKLR